MDNSPVGSIDIFGRDRGHFLTYVDQLVNSQHTIIRREVNKMMKKATFTLSLKLLIVQEEF